jgi:hypothetical protein
MLLYSYPYECDDFLKTNERKKGKLSRYIYNLDSTVFQEERRVEKVFFWSSPSVNQQSCEEYFNIHHIIDKLCVAKGLQVLALAVKQQHS